ncbi:hypothetical protein GHT06_007891 [Daphnia sinensis]|uniref:Fatty acyl-CoA reductase n=1 Tax=Daphnia sinensis TaxID=1820382 RepID=A0AAD5LUA5_9CRUS|nr:hypothetical protein GHT06_007891 [Daphnia sinensis]
MEESSIAEFYKGRSVFITGATGFMGKVLVEKLLRSCPGVDKLYLLMRPSKGKDVSTRLREFTENQVFENLRNEHPEQLEKIAAVAGDVTFPGFGLSSEDMQLIIDNVSIVFNSAATVKFDEELKTAVQLNVKGPRELLAICRKMKKLQAVVHVSTAFNNLDREELDEVIYPAPIDPIKLIELIDCLDDGLVRAITKELVGQCPNTYTYTKALAEQLLERECGDIPLAIVRPSIVTAAEHEPLPGWVDNLNGPTGFVSGVGKGFIRTFKINSQLVGDIVPVDYPINLMIAVGWHTAIQNRRLDKTSGIPKKIEVYNCSTGQKNPLTWEMFREIGFKYWLKYPTVEMMWYPNCSFTKNSTVHKIDQAISHYLPAYALDLVARLTGKRVKWVRLYDRAHHAISCLDFFMTHQWRFVSENPIRLLDFLSEADRRTFYFDVRQIDWNTYIGTYVAGARRYILKDDPSTLPAARRNLKKLYAAKMLLRLTLLAVFFLVLSYLWQQLSSWGSTTPGEYMASDNITFLHLQSEVEKETSNQGINPYLTSGIKS